MQPFFFLSQPKWPKLQFSAYLVICIMGWVGFFSAIIKSGWHIKSQIRRSSLVSKYIVFWLKKRVWCLGSFLHIYCPLFSIKCSIKSEPNGGFLLIFQEILFLYIEGSRQKQRGKWKFNWKFCRVWAQWVRIPVLSTYHNAAK